MKRVGLSNKDEQWPNSCNVNLYENGGSGVEWHSDNEPLFGNFDEENLIVSLSLGASRRFEVRKIGEAQSWETMLHDGDLITMEGMFHNVSLRTKDYLKPE